MSVNNTACFIGSSLLSVHPVGPEIWGAWRMLLSVWFVIPTHPLSCVAPEKKSDSCFSTWLQLRGLVCSSLCFSFESNFWSSTSSSDLPVWQFLPHALWSSDLTGKRLGEENPAFWVLTTMLLCLRSGSLSPLASALCKLWVWDVYLEAQMSVYVLILYFLCTNMILSSIFSLLLKKVSQ